MEPTTRQTRQRAAIRRAIEEAQRPLLPHEVLDAARDEVPGLGIATVYRTLKSLVADGALRPVTLPGEGARYEPAAHHHHHHFRCTRCERVFDVHACPGDMAALAPPGFVVHDHDLTLHGLCSDCAKGARRRRQLSGTATCSR